VTRRRSHLPDLRCRADIDVLVRRFYERALGDAELAPVFDVLGVVGLDEHLVVVGDFWEQILFRTTRYDGAFIPVHRALHGHHGLTSARFERWLALWTENVDALFAGANADRAKIKADAMARSLARSLGAGVS